MKDHPEKRLGRRGSREAIDWIDAVQQLEGSICQHPLECLQLFALILADRPALGIYGEGLARCLQLFSSFRTNKTQRSRPNVLPPKPNLQALVQLNALRRPSHHSIPKNGLFKLRTLDWLMVNHQLALRKSNLHSRPAYGHPCTPCTVH